MCPFTLPLLLALAGSDASPVKRGVVVQPVDFATLTPRQAGRLHGWLETFVVRPLDPGDDIDGREVYECDDSDGVTRTVWLLPVEDRKEGPLVIRGRLKVIRHAAWRTVPAFVEYRLVQAR